MAEPENKRDKKGHLMSPLGRMPMQIKYEPITREDGTLELADKTKAPFYPTDDQIRFIEEWLWNWDNNLSEYHAIHTIDGKMGDLKRWRRDPEFVALCRNEVDKRFDGILPQVKAILIRSVEDPKFTMTKQEKWAIEKVLKVEEANQAAAIKIQQIYNTQNNFYGAVTANATDEQLERIISGNNGSQDPKIIEGTAGSTCG